MIAIRDRIGALVHYPDPRYLQLRSAIGRRHDLPIEWILPGNGVAELLTLAGRDLAERETVHVLAPGFADYERALSGFNARVRRHSLDLATLDNANTDRDGLLLNNPHNPTGKIWTVSEIRPYLDRFDLVVLDEAFMDFLPPKREESCISLLRTYPNLVILRSLTKFYSLPGLRIGYALGHPDRLDRWREWRDPWSVNSLAAAAAIACLEDTDFQNRTWHWLPPAREELREGFKTIDSLHPRESAANFLLVRADFPVLPLQSALLKEHRIFIRDCLSFPELGENYFRVAVRAPSENQKLLRAIENVLNQYRFETRAEFADRP